MRLYRQNLTDKDHLIIVLDPLFHDASYKANKKKNQWMWKSYLILCQTYAQAILKKYRPGDLVWIHDYQLVMLPHFLRKAKPDIKIDLSLYAKFPNWGHLAEVEDISHILRSMLQADHIAFKSKADAAKFATACQQIQSTSASLLPSLRPQPMGTYANPLVCEHCNQQHKRPSKSERSAMMTKRVKQLRAMFPHRQLIFSRSANRANLFRTLAAFADLLSKHRFMVDRTVLFLFCTSHSLPAKEWKAVHEIARQINQIYGTTEFVPVHLYHQELDAEEEEAFMTASDLGVFLDNPNEHHEEDDYVKRFVISQQQRHAPLLIHPSASLASAPIHCRQGVLTVIQSPHDISSLASALYDNLAMCSIHAKAHYEALYHHVLATAEATASMETSVLHETDSHNILEEPSSTDTLHPPATTSASSPAGQEPRTSPLPLAPPQNTNGTMGMHKAPHAHSRTDPRPSRQPSLTKNAWLLKEETCTAKEGEDTSAASSSFVEKEASTTALMNHVKARRNGKEKEENETSPSTFFSRTFSAVQTDEQDRLPVCSLKLKAHTAFTDWHTKYLRKVSMLKVLAEYPSPVT
ncbi:glycosyltransferase family 20-domain-containing protein [Mycotypha africana]|uniref:glycosyltransferase family 20-domain-containing protein n=1 Tax=Mycotypha africana TaxID=64632 RepID=UPI0023018C40|nr:glycosyltransferase family 20-domain-containing protein [Mycotypha africana]KAI8981942.1 glycosyltransferase family 20-domain-containing protein [Mycotypha africana]